MPAETSRAIRQAHPGHPSAVEQQFGDRGALPDACPRGPRRHRERLRGLVRVAVAATGLEGEGGERFQIGERPQCGDVGRVDLLGLHADGALGDEALAQGVDVGRGDADDVAGLAEADVVTEQLLGILEHLEPDGGHRRQRADAVVAPDDAGGLARHTRADRIALDDKHIGDPALSECPRRGGALDATADDDDVGRLGHGSWAFASSVRSRRIRAPIPAITALSA